ncbi:hypothetical protein J4Q44_G00092110 [Coregonus suidteri]|uniref:Uncharacterized protein n=1 Tax=Coregonus suidteri TaxID=861788 RepID=A0AAN8QYW2_9TELE
MAPGLTFRAFWICFLLFDGANCLPAQKGNPVLRKYPFRNIESNSYGGMPAPYGDASGLLNSGGFPRSGSDSGSAATSYQFSGGKPAPSFVSVQREPVPQSQELGQYTQLVSTPTKPKPMPSRLSLTKGGTVPSEYELKETVEQANYSSVYDDHVSSHSDSAQTRTSTEHEPNEIIPAPSDNFVQEPENASTVPAGESVSKTYGSFSNAGSTFGNDGGAYNSFEAQREQVSNVKQPFKVSKTGYAPTVQRPSPSSSSYGKDGQALSSNSGGYLSAPRLSPPRPSIPFPYPLGHGKTSPSEFAKAAQTGHVPIVRKPSLSRPFSVQGSPSSSDNVSTSKVNPAIQFPKPTSYQPGPRKMSPSVSEQRQQIPIEQGPKDVAYKPSSFHNADSTFGSYAGVSSSYNAQAEQVPNVQWPSDASQTGYAPIVQKPSHSSPGQGGPYRTGGYELAPLNQPSHYPSCLVKGRYPHLALSRSLYPVALIPDSGGSPESSVGSPESSGGYVSTQRISPSTDSYVPPSPQRRYVCQSHNSYERGKVVFSITSYTG